MKSETNYISMSGIRRFNELILPILLALFFFSLCSFVLLLINRFRSPSITKSYRGHGCGLWFMICAVLLTFSIVYAFLGDNSSENRQEETTEELIINEIDDVATAEMSDEMMEETSAQSTAKTTEEESEELTFEVFLSAFFLFLLPLFLTGYLMRKLGKASDLYLKRANKIIEMALKDEQISRSDLLAWDLLQSHQSLEAMKLQENLGMDFADRERFSFDKQWVPLLDEMKRFNLLKYSLTDTIIKVTLDEDFKTKIYRTLKIEPPVK